jgi:hypothetical protein
MEELTAFLNSIRRQYPFGIPRSLIEAASAEASISPQVSLKKLLLIGDTLSSSGRELLKAAMEKGLKTNHYEILLTSELADGVMARVKSEDVSAIILFSDVEGLEAGRGALGKLIVKTLHPNEVGANPNLKKEFWAQIQKVIPEIA